MPDALFVERFSKFEIRLSFVEQRRVKIVRYLFSTLDDPELMPTRGHTAVLLRTVFRVNCRRPFYQRYEHSLGKPGLAGLREPYSGSGLAESSDSDKTRDSLGLGIPQILDLRFSQTLI